MDTQRAGTTTNDIAVSVVVPVYNAGEYLARCAPSLLRQSIGTDCRCPPRVGFAAVVLADGRPQLAVDRRTSLPSGRHPLAFEGGKPVATATVLRARIRWLTGLRRRGRIRVVLGRGYRAVRRRTARRRAAGRSSG